MAKNSRTLIKLDDKLIEITKGAKGLQAKELTDDEVLEVSLLDEGVEKLIQNDINRLTNEAYAELQQGFKDTLKQNVLRLAGFEGRWGNGYEVDHCNGRQSMMSQYLSSKVQQMITSEIDLMITPADLVPLLKETKKGLLKDIKDRFGHYVRDEIYKQTQLAAKEFVADSLKKSMTKFQKEAIEKAETAFLGRNARNEDED